MEIFTTPTIKKYKKVENSKTEWDMSNRYKEATVKCEFCGETFNTWKLYAGHAKLVHFDEMRKKWIACKECDAFFPSKFSMITHKAKIHSNAELRDASGRFACSYCTKSYLNMLDYNKHCLKDHLPQIRQDWLACPRCDLFFRNAQGLLLHTKAKHKEPDSTNHNFQCSFCPKLFTRIHPMYQHANRYHLEEVEKDWYFNPRTKLYFPKKPEIDGRSFRGEDIIGEEGMEAIRKPKIWCEFCSASVTYNYLPHANKHHKDLISKLWLGCSQCDQYFPTKSSLDGHNMAKHKLMTREIKRHNYAGSNGVTCDFCPRLFSRGQFCWSHAEREHKEKIVDIWLQCPTCQAYLPNENLLKTHIASKHKIGAVANPDKACPYCSAIFPNGYFLTRHTNRMHLDLIKDLWYPCTVCNTYFQTERRLEAHKSQVNHMVKINCDFCQEYFFHMKDYISHANEVHTDAIIESWELCFSCHLRAPNLSKHTCKTANVAKLKSRQMKLEDEIENFHCEFCSESFGQETDMVSHCNRVHFDDICSVWVNCEKCLEYLPSEQTLKKHKLSVHSEKRRKRKLSIKSEEKEEEIWTPKKAVTSRRASRKAQKSGDEDFAQTDTSRSRRSSRRLKQRIPYEENDFDDEIALDTEWEPLVKIEGPMENGIEFSQADVVTVFSLTIKSEPDEFEDFEDKEEEDENKPLSKRKKRKKKAIFNIKEENEEKHIVEDEGLGDGEETKAYPDEQSSSYQNKWNIIGDQNEEDIEAVVEKVTERKSDLSSRRRLASSPKPVDPLPKFDLSQIVPDDLDDNEERPHSKKLNPRRVVTSSGKGGSYKLPYDATHAKLVSSIDRNGVESQRVQCEYCSKTHINIWIYHKHVNKDHLEMAMLYWIPCPTCNKYFATDQCLANHNRMYHSVGVNKRSHLCDFCSSTHCDSTKFYRHATDKHADIVGKIWIECKVCHLYLPTEDALTGHVKMKHPKYYRKILEAKGQMTSSSGPQTSRTGRHKKIVSSCDFCDSSYTDRSNLMKHIRRLHQDEMSRENDPTVCNFCQVTFDTKDIFYAHITSAHISEAREKNWVACMWCNCHMPSESCYAIHRMNRHLNSKTSEGGYKIGKKRTIECQFCSSAFKDIGQYHSHANRVHELDLFQAGWNLCDPCDNYYPTDIIESHRVNCSTENNSEKINCQFCAKIFKVSKSYHDHANTRHKDLLVENNWLPCVGCNFRFPEKNSLKNHKNNCGMEQSSDSKRFRITCEYCPQTFPRFPNYFSHANVNHRKEIIQAKWLHCSSCDRYIIPHRFNIHVQYCREDREILTTPTVCEFCSDEFHTQQSYFLHANSEHGCLLADATWIRCSKCENYYPDEEAMQTHMCGHKDQERYFISCPHCPMTFRNKPNFMAHSQKKHRDKLIEANWIPCPDCDKLCMNENKLKTHRAVWCQMPTKPLKLLPRKKEGPIKCLFCREIQKSRAVFYDHANVEHLDEIAKTWASCPECSKYFPDMTKMRMHLAKHANSEYYKPEVPPSKIPCDFCPESFHKHWTCIAHANEAHLDQVLESGWVPCPICEKFIPRTRNMKRHMGRCQNKE